MVNGLDYLKKTNDEIKKLNRTVTTEIKVDEEKIISKVSDKMKRELSRRTTEFVGSFGGV